MTGSMIENIGNTPIVQIVEEGFFAKVYAKLENLNPAGSIKDRVAKCMIEDAEQSGKLKKGGTIIEATSGNTGIGLALVGKEKGYRVIITMPNTMSVERIRMIEGYGATVILTDGKQGMQGAVNKAEEILNNTPNSIIAGQFENPSNPKAHYTSTAPEIYNQLNGKVDILVAGIGTGGTISGTGKYLKEKNPLTIVVGVEPESSPLITKGYSGPHKIQGIGANFIPKTFDKEIVDKVMTVSDEDAYLYKDLLNEKHAQFVGISAGASYKIARELALKEENKGKNIVVIFPDSGDRYLSVK